jgi:hypothetical protein
LPVVLRRCRCRRHPTRWPGRVRCPFWVRRTSQSVAFPVRRTSQSVAFPVRRTSQSVAAVRGGMLGPNNVCESSSPRSGESM